MLQQRDQGSGCSGAQSEMTERTSRFLFRTNDLPEQDRLATWLEVIGRRYMRLQIEPREAGRMEASVEALTLPFGEIASAECDPARFTRTRELLQDGNGDYAFNWVRQSGYRIIDNAGETLLGAGDSILLFYGAPGSFGIDRRARLTNVRLNGALVRSKIPDIDERLFHRLPSNGVALRLLQTYVNALLTSGIPADPLLAHNINDHLVDLIAASLREDDDTVERALADAVPAARLVAAKAEIRERLYDPALSAGYVALRLGLSERSIYLLFERSGLSFAAFVTEERLKRAAAMLLDPACLDRIGDIALATGFGDLSTFNRSFRRRYGRTPSGMRRSRTP